MKRLYKFLIRTSSFQRKELIEIFRQPKLILTLVLGPFLIMFLFGLAYPDQSRPLRTIFVVTNPNAYQEQINNFTNAFRSSLTNYEIESDKTKALSKLALNQTDLVIIVPDVPDKAIQSNQQAQFLVYHNEIDPFQIGYVQAVATIYVGELNREVLQAGVEQQQAASGSLQTNLETAITQTQALRKVIPPADVNSTAQAAGLEMNLTDLHAKLKEFRSLSASILVTPFTAKVLGLLGVPLSVTAFFTPAVIVLLLQHVSITFASLSIVRERRSGIMELFRVAPINAFETLVGKYLSYLFFEIILAGVMAGLAVWLLKTPLAGHWLDFAIAVIALLFTSLGLGFLISLISDTDTQAVQYAMLLLLLSIFFCGFFMDLRLLREPITLLAWSLPATYGIRMLQDIMLRELPVPQLICAGLILIGIGLFIVDWILLRRKMDS